MFTPEGYWSWTETIAAASYWTMEIVSASLASDLTIEQIESSPYRCREMLCNKLVSSKGIENLSEARFAMELMELWLLANFIDQYEAVLCSADGRTLRCPPIIKSHGDALDWWVWPLSKENMSHGEAYGYFDAFRSGKFKIADAQARFCALDYETGTIRLKPNTERLLLGSSYGHGMPEEDTLRFIDEQMRPIIGWSICWNENSIPKTRIELFENLGFRDLDWSGLENSETKPQSPTMEGKNILDCIMTAFPDGKGQATWQDVEANVGYSRRSIIRELKRDGSYSRWAKTGQNQ